MTRAELRVVGALMRAQARRRPGRVVLSALATVAAACIVVWVVSGYDALVGQFGGMGEEYVGRYALLLLPNRPADSLGTGERTPARLAPELLDALRRDPAVAAVEPVFETSARVARADAGGPQATATAPAEAPFPAPPAQPTSGPILMGGMAQLRTMARLPTLVGLDAAEPPQSLRQGRWFDPTRTDRREGVMTRDSAEVLGVKPGDEVRVTGIGRGAAPASLTIVGVVEQPKRLPGPRFMVGLPPSRDAALPGGPTSHAVYVSTKLAAQLGGGPLTRASYAGVALRPDTNPDGFVARWAERFAAATPPVEARTAAEVDRAVDSSTTFEAVRAQAYSALGIALLASLFITFTTLSMGVDERVRQFAMLRAVALSRTQVGVLVVLEGLVLGLIGWAGGLLAGWGLLALMARLRPESVAEGAALGGWSVALSGVGALGGALAASVLPAWRATRVTPLEAMAPRVPRQRGHIHGGLAAVGLALIAVNPLVVFVVPMPDQTRLGASAVLGCPTMVVGFVLLAPLLVISTERTLGPLLARLLGLNSRLLATQLSANMPRTVGTTTTLTIGLGLFVAMQTWGYSMLAPFTPGDWSPDLLVSLPPPGLPEAEVDAVRHVPGVIPARFLPLALRQVKFADDPTGSQIRSSATRQDNCVMIGVDPDAAFGGADPLFGFQFVEGSRDGALLQLKQGRHCLVPDHFAREANLGLGGKFRVVAPNDPDHPLEYEVAGVVAMPGWHWMTKSIRRGRAAGLMFAATDVVRRDFRTGPTTTFWGDLDGSATEDQIKASLGAIIARRPGARPGPALGPPGARPRPPAPAVTLASVAGVRQQVRERADPIIWTLSELPLVTLLVASLGVVNTVLASVRARRWDLGVLRSLGLTRSGLFRLIMAEAVLIGVVACALSLGFGALAGYCGTGVTRYINIRGGQSTPLVIPWLQLWPGFALTLGLCLLAALWPAVATGRTEPLRLLQAGRSLA